MLLKGAAGAVDSSELEDDDGERVSRWNGQLSQGIELICVTLVTASSNADTRPLPSLRGSGAAGKGI